MVYSGDHPAMACEPYPDYWFVETFKVEEVALPEGVEILASDPAAQERGYLSLNNQTETLLFVLSLSYKDVLVMETPDPNWKSRVNMAHEVASYLVVPDRPTILDMEKLTDLDRNLVDRNVLELNPPPADVVIPAAQHSELLLVSGEQVIEVPFTLTYTLNTNFESGADGCVQWPLSVQSTDNANATATQQVEASAVRAARDTRLVIGLVGVTILMIVGWLVWRGLVRRMTDE
jgi:hypothetical protein